MTRANPTEAEPTALGDLPNRDQLLQNPVEHIDIKATDVRPMVDAFGKMAFSSRDLHRAATIYNHMLEDTDCAVILCLAGSLVSAGLKHMIVDLIEHNMVDAICSTGANLVDQDFFEALGYRHYIAEDLYKSGVYDDHLREAMIDRIYDTFIDENELRVCDDLCRDIANDLEHRPYSSREFLHEMGKYLENNGGPKGDGRSIIYECYKRQVPMFVPAFSDCSAGFGLIQHQKARLEAGESQMLTLDSARDFLEFAYVKDEHPTTGLFMLGGGVPKNFAQDIAVAADIFGKDVSMHKYAIQVTVADPRDGALSSSTLKEACSWGKVDMAEEQMVFSEATLAAPLIAGYAYHSGSWKNRRALELGRIIDKHVKPRATAGVS